MKRFLFPAILVLTLVLASVRFPNPFYRKQRRRESGCRVSRQTVVEASRPILSSLGIPTH